MRGLIILSGVALLVLAAFLLTLDRDPAEAEESGGAQPEHADAGVPAALSGRASGEESIEEAAGLVDLARRAQGGTAEQRHAAVRDIQKRFAAGEVPLAALLAWALSVPAPDDTADLAHWARRTLVAHRPASLAYLPEILRAGLGTSEEQQSAVRATLRALQRVRAEDLDLVARLFEHEQTDTWLKLTLVDALEDLGVDALPVAPHLIDYVVQVLSERAAAARASLLVSGGHSPLDVVDYSVRSLLAAMGEGAVPLLTERLLAYHQVLLDRARASPGESPDVGDLLARHHEEAPLRMLSEALATSGPDGQRALAALLAHEDPLLRRTAAAALDSEHVDGDLLLDPLKAALEAPDPVLRHRAARALEHCGTPAVPILLAALEDASPGLRKTLAYVLTRLQVDAQHTLPPLQEVLADEDEFVVLKAVRAIATYGPDAVATLPSLLPHLATEDAWFRSRYAEPIAAVAVHAPETLVDPWSTGDAALRLGLLKVIATPKTPPPAWNGLLARGLDDADLAVRVQAAAQLASAGRTDVLTALLAGFRSDNGRLRAIATHALGHLDREAVHLLSDMLERLAQEDRLWRSSEPGNVERGERTALSQTVRLLGRHDLPRMFEILDHSTFSLSYAAAGAFHEAGPDGLAFFEGAWASATAAKRMVMLEVAGQMLRHLEERALTPAVAHLAERGLEDADPQVRLQAVKTLEKATSLRERRLVVLAALLDDPSIDVVRTAAYRISNAGAHAAHVEATLRRRAEHEDAQVRRSIRTALENIEDAR